MYKKIIAAVLLCGVILLSMCSFAPIKAETKVDTPAVINNEKVLEARFLNMLNHSFVYDKAFYDDEELLNASSLALLDYQTDGFIHQRCGGIAVVLAAHTCGHIHKVGCGTA